MIRINLLPVRQVKKREYGRQIIALILVMLLATVVGNYLWLASREDVRNDRQAMIDETTKRISELEKVIGEVNNITKRKKEVEDKLKVLSDLRKGRSGPVKLLDALSTATPKKVWIKEFTEANNSIRLTGLAVSHDDVAEFMRSLANIVWTSKGMGRVVERRRDTDTARIELLNSEGEVEDFPNAEVGAFFSNVELKRAEARLENNAKRVDFEINLLGNYAI